MEEPKTVYCIHENGIVLTVPRLLLDIISEKFETKAPPVTILNRVKVFFPGAMRITYTKGNIVGLNHKVLKTLDKDVTLHYNDFCVISPSLLQEVYDIMKRNEE
jgi:hypothetical protein